MVVVACREVSIYTPDGSKLILGSNGTGNSNSNNNSAAYTVRTLHSNSSNAIYNLPTPIPTPMPTPVPSPVRIQGVYNLTKPGTPVGGGGGGGGGSSGEEGVNLTVCKGDRILLVGPSGVGRYLHLTGLGSVRPLIC